MLRATATELQGTVHVNQAYSAEIARGRGPGAGVRGAVAAGPDGLGQAAVRVDGVPMWLGARGGAKDKGQARVLAVDLTREGFDALLLRAARGDARVAPGGAGLEPPRAAAAAGQAKQRFERRSECGERHYRAVGPGGRPGHRRRPARAG